MPTHIYLQETPTMIAEIDAIRTLLIQAPDRETADRKLKEQTGPPRSDTALRNDGGTAYNVQYLGTAGNLTDQEAVTDVTDLFDPEEAYTIEGLAT